MKPIFRLGNFQPDPDKDVRDELQSHIEFKVEELIAGGMSEEDARDVAGRGIERSRKIEQDASRYALRVERKRWLAYNLDAFRQDLKYAGRSLLRARGMTALTLFLLALGIGVNTSLFSTLKGVFLDPLPLPDGHELVFLWEQSSEAPMSPVSIPNFQDWQEGSRTVDEMGAYLARHVNLTDNGEATQVRGALTTASLFSVFQVHPVLGRTLSDEENFSGLPVAVLDNEIWRERYGADPEIVGKAIDLDGISHTVVGVMPRGFLQPDPISMEPIRVWVPLPAGTEFEPRFSHSYQVLGRLSGESSIEDARSDMARVARVLSDEYPDSNDGVGVRVESAHEVLFGEAGGQLLLILGAAGLVLLIACGNIASIQLARSTLRRGEMAVRGALGGSKGRILRQLVTESALLALVGGTIGLLFAFWSLDILRTLIPPEIPRLEQIHLDGMTLAYALGVSLAVGALFGLAPALDASRVRLSETLKDERRDGGGGGKGSRLQSAFIVGQFALSLVLANAAILLFQSQAAIRDNELGFEPANVLTMDLSLRGSGYSIAGGRAEFYDELFPRLLGLPGVLEVGASTSLPLMGGSSIQVVREENWVDGSEEMARTMDLERVAGDFFGVLEIPLLRGRTFVRGEDDTTRFMDTKAILNQAAADAMWPGQDPLGKRISYPGESPDWMTVVGIVGNVRNRGLGLAPHPGIYLPYASYPTGRMALTLKTEGDPESLGAAVREEIRRVDPLQAVAHIKGMDGVIRAHLSRRDFYTTLIGAFAGLALILAAAGVYGVLSLQVASRTREIGLRMALGSGEGKVLSLMVGQAMVLAATGLALGLGGVILSKGLIRSYLYGVGFLEPITLSFGISILLLVAFVAAIVPARRASRVDPVKALRWG